MVKSNINPWRYARAPSAPVVLTHRSRLAWGSRSQIICWGALCQLWPGPQSSPKLCSRQISVLGLPHRCSRGFLEWPWTRLVTPRFSNDRWTLSGTRRCPQPCSARLALCCGVVPVLAASLSRPMRDGPWLLGCLPWWGSPHPAAPWWNAKAAYVVLLPR